MTTNEKNDRDVPLTVRYLKLSKIAGELIMAVGIILGVYVGGWLMIVRPVYLCIKAFNMGTLTVMRVMVMLAQLLFSLPVASVIVMSASWIADAVAGGIRGIGAKKQRK